MDPKVKAMLREEFAKGKLFEGKYRIEGHLGTGSFAYVMLAKHEAMERRVALKVLKPDLVNSNPDLLERFVNEVKIVGRLKHPNTVTVFDYGRTERGVHYLVMEYVEGVALEDVLTEQGALSPERAVSITQQILKSLAEAHANGIVHRDLKPSNIMLTHSHDEKEIVKVLDFGVAKLINQNPNSPRSADGRRSTQFIGTPVYMSPEQVLGQTVVPASDLYSLGLIFYEMLTGDSPFDGVGIAHIAQAHIDTDVLPLAKLGELSPTFRSLIVRATARKPSDRFRDVGAFGHALPELAAGHSGEFATLLDESSAASQDDFLAAFSGKNYIEAPASEAFEDVRPVRRSQPLKPAQPARLNQDEAPRRSSNVELDVGAVRRTELKKRRSQSGPQVAVVKLADWPGRAWILAGVSSFPVSFMIASTVWVDGNGPDRWLVGLLPAVVAVVWSQFASVKRHHGTKFETIAVPIAKHMVLTTLAVVAVVAITGPEGGASRMGEAGTWFVADVENGTPLHGVRIIAEGVAAFLAAVFSAFAKVLPW